MLSSRQKFDNQRKHAKARNIKFLLSFHEWLSIWDASGHFHERGRGRGKYVMARIGDKGPYAVGNVKIIPAEENNKEQSPPWQGHKHTKESRAKMSAAAIGNKKGTANKGRTFSKETIAKMRAAKIGNRYRAESLR